MGARLPYKVNLVMTTVRLCSPRNACPRLVVGEPPFSPLEHGFARGVVHRARVDAARTGPPSPRCDLILLSRVLERPQCNAAREGRIFT